MGYILKYVDGNGDDADQEINADSDETAIRVVKYGIEKGELVASGGILEGSAELFSPRGERIWGQK